MGAEAEARIWAAVGASGTGKGLWIKDHLKKEGPDRLVIWDFKREYADFTGKPVKSLKSVQSAMLKAGAAGPLRISYCPVGAGKKEMMREFEALCELTYAWEHCTYVVEELANVTTPSWAPNSWLKMTTSGRHAEIHIIGATQMPTIIDKTFLGCCTKIHCGPLRQFDHRQQMARSMDLEQDRFAKLVKFQWIEKDFDTGEVIEGWTRPPGANARANARGEGKKDTPKSAKSNAKNATTPTGPSPKPSEEGDYCSK